MSDEPTRFRQSAEDIAGDVILQLPGLIGTDPDADPREHAHGAMALLLAAGWCAIRAMAKSDPEMAQRYVCMLRSHADSVERDLGLADT